MKRKWLVSLSCLVMLFLSSTPRSWAGQVVTEEIKLWAKKVLGEEKALKASEEKNALAVIYFQNKTGRSELDPLQKGITLMLITDLSKVSGLQVIERVRLQALVEEMGLGTTGLVVPETAPRVGRLLGAHWIVGGDILKGQPDQFKLESSPLEVPTEKILGRPMTEGKLEETFRMEKELLFDIVKLLRVDVKPVEEELKKPCSTNVRALMALFRAVDASDRKNYEGAAEFYQKALKEDPNVCLAGDALRELEALKLLPAVRRTRSLLRSLRDGTSLTDTLTNEDPQTKRPGGGPEFNRGRSQEGSRDIPSPSTNRPK